MKIISHDNCSDGLASALICKHAHPDADVEFHQYGTPEYEALPAEGDMLFVDIIPPRDRADEFVRIGARVLDHHKGAEDVVALFGDRGVFADEVRDPGVSGALLAFRHVYAPIVEGRGGQMSSHHVAERFARLTGIRDTWQTQDPDWELSQHQHAALMFWPRDYWLDRGSPWLDREHFEVGRIAHEKRLQMARRAADESWWVELPGGVRAAVLADPGHVTSDAADVLRAEGIQLVAGFFYVSRHKLVVSLRSDGSVDVAALAKKMGGGGHTRAACFRIDRPREDPFEEVAAALGELGRDPFG